MSGTTTSKKIRNLEEGEKITDSNIEKIDKISRTKNFNTVQQHPETAQMMIISPLITKGVKELFSTHPSTSERISRLNEIAKKLT